MKVLLSILLFSQVSLMAPSYATTASDVKDKAGETVDTAANYTREQKQAFVQEMEENLAALKLKIKEMKAKAGESKQATVQKLEKEQSELEQKLKKMKKSSGQAWGKLKTGVSKAWSEIKTSLSEAKEELNK